MTSLILETGTRAVFHTILLFSLYLLFSGHNAPGGGFIGGLVAGAALVLRYIAYGPDDILRVLRVRAEALLGAGLLAAVGAGILGWAIDGQFLASGKVDIALPAIGTLHVGSVLLFDIGVFTVVVGLVLGVLHSLGQELDV